MNTRAFSLALILAFVAMMMVWTYIDDKESAIIKKYGIKTTVVVAKKDIKAFELIDDSKVVTKTVPRSFAQPNVFKSIKDIENTLAEVPIAKGEQITKPRVTYPGAKTGLAQQVSVGNRALAIQVNARQAVSKLVKPGDRVDILAAIEPAPGRKDLQKIETILQDRLVLSTGKNISNSIPIYGVKVPGAIRKMNANTYSQYNTVTLELTPYEVQKILYIIQYSGFPLMLSLRNNSDKKRVDITPAGIFDLMGDQQEIIKLKQYFNTKYKKK